MKEENLAGSTSTSSRASHYAIALLLELVGLSRFELLTPRLSSVCSNQLSYRPFHICLMDDCQLPRRQSSITNRQFKELPILSKLDRAYVVAKTVKCPDRSLERLLLPLRTWASRIL